jgi:hypothetical protein
MQAYAAKNKKLQIIVALCGLLAANVLMVAQVHAATYMTHAEVIEYNMNASGTSSVAVAFTAGAADAAGSLAINFGTWGGTVNATQTASTAGCQALTGATNVLPGTLTAAGAGSVATVSGVSALTAGQSYCVVLSSPTAVTNPATTGQYPVTLTDGTDTASETIDIITNDQVVVSAVVPSSFTMSLSSNAATFGNLSATTLNTSSAVTATVATNANYGWYLWAQDTNAGLRSATESHTIPTITPGTNTNLSTTTGTEQYAFGVTASGGTTAAAYADAGGTTGGGLSSTNYNQIASSTAPTTGSTTTFKELANIAASTPAAPDYTDTISVIGAGSF